MPLSVALRVGGLPIAAVVLSPAVALNIGIVRGTLMRKVALSLALLAAVSAATAWADDGVVRLDSPAALEHLRATNPAHYAQAMKILASANHLCRPAAAGIQKAQVPDTADASCAGSLLRASDPPKREVQFSLGHTRYAALVTVTDDPPRLMAASGQP
jgi:hypothetical protein